MVTDWTYDIEGVIERAKKYVGKESSPSVAYVEMNQYTINLLKESRPDLMEAVPVYLANWLPNEACRVIYHCYIDYSSIKETNACKRRKLYEDETERLSKKFSSYLLGGEGM
jgi:hypothetical protein